jgi:hypothetical protein
MAPIPASDSAKRRTKNGACIERGREESARTKIASETEIGPTKIAPTPSANGKTTVAGPAASDELAALAARINAEHEAGDAAARKSLEHYRAAGEALIKAREECKRRKRFFLVWLRENVKAFGQARAYHYIAWAKLLVTRTLSAEQEEDEWRRISGNASREDGEQQAPDGGEETKEPGLPPTEDETGRGEKPEGDADGGKKRRKRSDNAGDPPPFRDLIVRLEAKRCERVEAWVDELVELERPGCKGDERVARRADQFFQALRDRHAAKVGGDGEEVSGD